MMRLKYVMCALFLIVGTGLIAQEEQSEERAGGHENSNKFRQLYEELATPNSYRTASGAPGHEYYQNTADYKMKIQLDDATHKITGDETITYQNNSPDDLEYLWVQLDQNIRSKDSPAKDKNGSGIAPVSQVEGFVGQYMSESFDGGFNVHEVSQNGRPLKHTINFTMMRIDLPQALKSGESFEFSIKWDYNIPEHTVNRARSGYETYSDGNKGYVIAQFFPRMAVYNEVEGWQNYQFWGNGEFALPFGDYEVDITVPADHLLDGTGEIANLKDVYSKEEMKRWEQATKSFDKPVIIRTQAEAEAKAAGNVTRTKTWKLRAENVRDFAFTSSRRYIMDAQAVRFPERNVMAISIYPPEGNPLWEEYSTKAVVQTLDTYSKFTFNYPYPKAISVHGRGQGMEYPMICWNYDERQWGWMDEGLDTFMQYLTEQEFGENFPEAIGTNAKYPSRRGAPSGIVNYMKGNQERIAPIMSNPENVYQLGANAYGKPATALNILRETVMGPELFDHAFKT